MASFAERPRREALNIGGPRREAPSEVCSDLIGYGLMRGCDGEPLGVARLHTPFESGSIKPRVCKAVNIRNRVSMEYLPPACSQKPRRVDATTLDGNMHTNWLGPNTVVKTVGHYFTALLLYVLCDRAFLLSL